MVYYYPTKHAYAWYGITIGQEKPERVLYGQKIGERGLESMPKKGELSKTARASMANRDDVNHMTSRICAKCGEAIMLRELQPVKVVGKGMVYYHKSHYSLQ